MSRIQWQNTSFRLRVSTRFVLCKAEASRVRFDLIGTRNGVYLDPVKNTHLPLGGVCPSKPSGLQGHETRRKEDGPGN